MRGVVGERQRDRQAVRYLMNLIVVEEKTDPHARKTLPRRPSRIESCRFIGAVVDALMTGFRNMGLGR
jgi:hypothetical protein